MPTMRIIGWPTFVGIEPLIELAQLDPPVAGRFAQHLCDVVAVGVGDP